MDSSINTIDGTLLYQGYLRWYDISAHQESLKRVHVTLSKSLNAGGESLYKLKLGHKRSVTFSAEDLHFYEKDEIELKTPHTFLSCLNRKRKMPSLKHKRYLSVTLVIKTFDLVHCFILCGSTQKQLHEDSVGILWDTLKKEFGEIRSWFVKIPEMDHTDNFRFALTNKNFCLLDSTYNILKDFKFRMVKCNVSFNSATEMMELKVYIDVGVNYTDFEIADVIHLKATSKFAEDMNKIMVEKHLLLNEESPFAIEKSPVENEDSSSEIVASLIDNKASSVVSEKSLALKSIETLPPPCPHQPPVCVTLRKSLFPEDFDNPPKLNCRTNLIRSESTACITKCEENKRNHRNVFYENISQYDDRLYINELFPEQSHIRMKFRIDRWNRLSDELKEVNEDAAQRHWSYFDNQFKHRSRDDIYKKICNVSLWYDKPRPTGWDCEEDSSEEYWRSDLCLSIQRVMEGSGPKMWHIFSITHSQYLELSMKLDLRSNAPRAKDWTEFAEWIGIRKSRDIELIQHFCYTRKVVIMDVVFAHWYFQYERRRAVPSCNYNMLKTVLLGMERYDLIRVIDRNISGDENDAESDEDNTHF